MLQKASTLKLISTRFMFAQVALNSIINIKCWHAKNVKVIRNVKVNKDLISRAI